MALDPELAGREFPPTRPYDVSAAAISAFAVAIGVPADGEAAPPTFPIVVAFEAMQQLMQDPSVGIELHNVVHGEQRFVSTRPVVAGDVLTAQIRIESVRSMGGADIIGTRSEITAADDDHVCTAYATLVHTAQEPKS